MSVTDPSKTKPRNLPPRPWVVLLVDDEPDILRALGDLLEYSLAGVRVLRARSGREALGLLETERVDAIIADFKMSGMDGIEFLYIARKARPSVPRVMLTAYADVALAERATSEGSVQAFLSKAAGPDEFLDRVAGLLHYQPALTPGR